MQNIFLTVVLLLSPQINAQSACAPVDFRPQMGAPRDQGDSSWCYAHTSADLISHKVGFRVSAFDVATTYMLGDESKLASGKDPVVAEYLRLHPEFADRLYAERAPDPAYTDTNILSEDGLFDTGGDEELAIMIANSKDLCRESDLTDENDADTVYDGDLNAIAAAANLLTSDQKDALIKQYAFVPYVSGPEAVAKAGTFQTWVDQQCKARTKSPVSLSPGQFYIAGDADDWDTVTPELQKERQAILHDVIDGELSLNHPVAIGFDAYDLTERDAGDTAKHADHSAVIAGRRLATNACEYFVRFTYGRDCSYFLSQYQKACEQGGVWVTMDKIPTLYSAVWID